MKIYICLLTVAAFDLVYPLSKLKGIGDLFVDSVDEVGINAEINSQQKHKWISTLLKRSFFEDPSLQRSEAEWRPRAVAIEKSNPRIVYGSDGVTLTFSQPQWFTQFLKGYIDRGIVHINSGTHEKIHRIMTEGIDIFVCDFDGLFTKNNAHGKSYYNSSQLVIDALPESRRIVHDIMFKYYYKYEIDPLITHEELKMRYHEWYSQAAEILSKEKLTWERILEQMDLEPLILREGATDFLKMANEFRIPSIILSAGQGSVIKETLKRNNVWLPYIELISNQMILNEENILIGYENTIHPLNKNIAGKEISEIAQIRVKKELNEVLFGDGLQDLYMSEDRANRLTIGLVNDPSNVEFLNAMKEKYDIVLIGDIEFEFVVELFHLFYKI